jgi:hypothetical protein
MVQVRWSGWSNLISRKLIKYVLTCEIGTLLYIFRHRDYSSFFYFVLADYRLQSSSSVDSCRVSKLPANPH